MFHFCDAFINKVEKVTIMHFHNLYLIKNSISLYQIKESRNQYESVSWRGILRGGGPLTDGPHQPQYVQDEEVVEFTTQHEQGKNQKGNNQSREQKEKKNGIIDISSHDLTECGQIT